MSALNRGEKGYFGKGRVLEECRKEGVSWAGRDYQAAHFQLGLG